MAPKSHKRRTRIKKRMAAAVSEGDKMNFTESNSCSEEEDEMETNVTSGKSKLDILVETMTCSSEVTPLSTVTNGKSKLGILQDVVHIFQSNNVTDTEKNIFHLVDNASSKNKEIHTMIKMFIENLVTCEGDDLKYFEEHCSKIFCPKKLLDLCIGKNKTLKTHERIGEGGFGIVFKGSLFSSESGTSKVVAIKVPIVPEKERFLLAEAKIMTKLNHPNVVNILAFQKQPLKLVLEYMDQGSLSTLLLEKEISVNRQNLFKILYDILSGMEHLAQLKIVHRDIGCRNMFVNSQLQCKVGDFGMACYVGDTGVYKEEDGSLGDYNIAPEAIWSQEFTIKCDVWAIGVLIWESFNLNYNSFLHFLPHIHGIQIREIVSIFHLSRSLPVIQQMPTSLNKYVTGQIMANNPLNRPSFTEIKAVISTYVSRNI